MSRGGFRDTFPEEVIAGTNRFTRQIRDCRMRLRWQTS
jgi:hypothetical protein